MWTLCPVIVGVNALVTSHWQKGITTRERVSFSSRFKGLKAMAAGELEAAWPMVKVDSAGFHPLLQSRFPAQRKAPPTVQVTLLT